MLEKKIIYIRADGNDMIGTGHIMRCISVAEEIINQNVQVIFLVADKKSEELVRTKGFEVICLNSVWNELETEIDKLMQLIMECKIQVLLVDTYFVTKHYLERISTLTKVFYIDDLNLFLYPVYSIINYSIYADEFDYEKRYHQNGMDTRFYLGCEYTPLRSQFSHISYDVRKEVKNILITTGGADPFNIAGGLLAKLLKDYYFQDIILHMVSGIYNIHKDDLQKLAAGRKNVVMHENETNMAKLMLDCDIAITAGGTTLYELCACGIPTVAVSVADNQLDNVRRFEQEGLLKLAGDIRTDRRAVIDSIIEVVKEFTESSEERQVYSARMKQKNISGGSKRVAELLMNTK